MACLRCAVLDPFTGVNIPEKIGAFYATEVWFKRAEVLVRRESRSYEGTGHKLWALSLVANPFHTALVSVLRHGSTGGDA
jgi:hypothetical protein